MNSKNFNRLCAVDEFGRSFLPVKTDNSKKTVGIFYFLWNGYHDTKIRDLDKMLRTCPDKVFNMENSEESKQWDFHYWGEPLFGYYKAQDEYIIRKHIEMLTAAGVDYIMCDTTNAVIYPEAALTLLRVLHEYKQAGWNVPGFACYTNQGICETARHIYDVFYSKFPQYSDIWYSPNGKPVIAIRFDDKKDLDDDAEVRDFFEIWRAQWPNEPYFEDGFPWMEWVFPQPKHSDFISVSVAQHQLGAFSRVEGNWGRGCDKEGTEHHSDFRKGQNFDRQWNVANESGVNNVFVTGWNEWGAMKVPYQGEILYVDCFSEEYSRDTEPMTGGYHDAFYLQLISNIRRFKNSDTGTSPCVSKKIDINGDVSQWDGTETYEAFSHLNYTRNFSSIDPDVIYKTDAAENNILDVKVTHDKENIYFLIETENDITERENKRNWMNVFIGTDTPSSKGWNGYTHIINRREEGSCDKLNQSGNTVTYKSCRVIKDGKTMKIEVPRSLIGADADCKGIYFKVADSTKDFMDIDDYYVTGKVMPLGRLSYAYNF